MARRRDRRTRYTTPWRRLPPGVWARERSDGYVDAIIGGHLVTVAKQAYALAPTGS